ncbi:hypothetical protein SDC9_124886 [bioreactor metagenome]|uniref:Uncharacterized protein n=1 Tax=bioreactor metagenome TaxID=1076179 RepID=A0A645CLT9_9ZZZZ|nr:hypothetical protein [Oscillospiraceae bacterium]
MLSENDEYGQAKPDTAVFRSSAPALINTLIVMLDELDCYVKGIRINDTVHVPQTIHSLDDELYTHPRLCMGAMVLGLCYMLINEENEKRGAMFYALFRDESENIRRIFRVAKHRSVKNVY